MILYTFQHKVIALFVVVFARPRRAPPTLCYVLPVALCIACTRPNVDRAQEGCVDRVSKQ